jgi:trk system potassium uptake protein TrkA
LQTKKVLVIGLGRFGGALANELWDVNAELIVVDKDPEAVDAHKARASAAFVADASDAGVLERLGARDVDVAVVTAGENFEASVMCVLQLAELGVKTIFARAASDRQAHVLRAVGATRAIQVESEMGFRVALQVLNPVATELLDFATHFRVVPWVVPQARVGKTLAELKLRDFEVNVLGYLRPEPGQKPRMQLASAEYRVLAGDTLLLVGEDESLEHFLSSDG